MSRSLVYCLSLNEGRAVRLGHSGKYEEIHPFSKALFKYHPVNYVISGATIKT